MAYTNTEQRRFERPAAAKNYRHYDKVSLNGPMTPYSERAKLPALAKLRPAKTFNWFSEPTSEKDPATEVFCSGNVFLTNDRTGIGVLRYDAVPGEVTELVREGLFYLPLDYEGNPTSPVRQAASLSDLAGKTAYYLVNEGLFTDKKPASQVDYPYLTVGRFADLSEGKPRVPIDGNWFASIYLDPSIQNDAVSLPADSDQTPATKIDAVIEISDYTGLAQRLTINAFSSDPNYPVRPEDVVWSIDGTEVGTGYSIEYRWGTAGSKTVSATVSSGSVSKTVTYTVTLAADAAPASWNFISSETDFISFSMAEQDSAASIDYSAHTIAIDVANGTNPAALVATFELSDGASAAVGATPQVSGTTANDFSSPVEYVVTAEDGVTTQTWTVTVTVL